MIASEDEGPRREELRSQRVWADGAARAPSWAHTGWGAGIVPLVLLVGLWQIAVVVLHTPPEIFPSPERVVQALAEVVRTGELPSYVALSLGQWIVGVGIGIISGVVCALVLSASRLLVEAMLPVANFFYAIVEFAWLPIFLIWFGYGSTTVIICVAYSTFFPVMFTMLSGIESMPRSFREGLVVLGARRTQVLFYGVIPGSLPSLITGVRIGAGFAFRSLIGAEFIAGFAGLGYMVSKAAQFREMDVSVGGMIIIGLAWILIDRMYIRPIEAATTERWRGVQ